MKTALYYNKLNGKKVQCTLCPHKCTMATEKTGECGVRRNVDGELISETYRHLSALHYDPVEKKPLYHFHPGSVILSVGTVGCNLSCSFCQNCNISQATVADMPGNQDYEPWEVVEMAAETPRNKGIAFTYNEPTIFYEYMLETAKLAKTRFLKTAMVSNGYINPAPLEELMPYMDAFNIDLKAFREDFYREEARASLEPVKNTLKSLSTNGKHLEITNLVIPGLNDDRIVFAEMIDWIAGELGNHTVLHLSRYFPHHKMKRDATPLSTLVDLYELARKKLPFVYLGNVHSVDGQDTFCPECSALLVSRKGYNIQLHGIGQDHACFKCGNPIKNFVL